jgi:hypothetical protein
MSDLDKIRRLFKEAGALRVVHLDDAYAPVSDDLLSVFRHSTLAQLLELEQEEPDAGPEIVIERVRERLDDLGEEERAQLAERARAAEGDDPGTYTALRALFGATINTIHPGATTEETRDKLADALADGDAATTIVFVDDELGSGQTGRHVAAKLLEERDDVLAVFLVTHHVGSLDAELALEQEIGVAEVVVLAKNRFSNDDASDVPEAKVRDFAARLRRGMVATRIRSLKVRVDDAIQVASTFARKHFAAMSVEELDFIVARTAADEGAWLGDLLMRILTRSFDHAAMLQLRKDTSVHEHAAIMSRLCDKDFVFGPPPPLLTDKAVALQRHEMFLTAEVLRDASVEIRGGDVFADDSGRLILVGQACDLAVRGDGKRDKRLDLDQMGWLASVSEQPESELPGTFEHVVRHMDGARPGNVWKAKMSKSLMVPLWILDLAVFDDDGVCRMTSETTARTSLPPSWRKRFDVVRGYAEDIAKNYHKVQDRDVRIIAGLPRANQRVSLRRRVDRKARTWSVDFGLRRVCHLEGRYSDELLRLKAAYLMRWAEDRDLSEAVRPGS